MRFLERCRREAGSATVFVLGMSIVLFVCAGLVVDGGLAINARMRVADDAEQASRVGADSINLEVLRAGGGLEIDPDLAQQRASNYLQDRGYGTGQYDIEVDGGTVRVLVRDTSETKILRALGIIDEYDVRAGAVSEPETGP
jgi:Flp pilus assembly protein TadG